MVALDNDRIEDVVEQQWFSARVPRKTLRGLMARSDGPALFNFGLWILLLLGSGYFLIWSWLSWWSIPALFLYGTVWSSSDARWHECGHGTAFKTRWLNDMFYHISSFMTLREAYMWRWSHARHHTETYFPERDLEIQVGRPAKLWPIVLDFFNLVGGTKELINIHRRALGIMTEKEKAIVPESERPKMFLSSRIYVAIYVASIAASIAIGSVLPFVMVVLPRFFGGWHHQLCGLTQHAALAINVRDHRLNTRTVYMNPVYRFLYLNMNYHIEHHMFPMIPFHALPKLHAEIKHQLPRTSTGIIDAYREIIPALVKQSRDASYYIARELPDARAAAAMPA